jgi:hypothetical protein
MRFGDEASFGYSDFEDPAYPLKYNSEFCSVPFVIKDGVFSIVVCEIM